MVLTTMEFNTCWVAMFFVGTVTSNVGTGVMIVDGMPDKATGLNL